MRCIVLNASNEQQWIHTSIQRALQHEEEGNTETALKMLNELCSAYPHLGEVWLERGLLLDKHDQEKEAIPNYQQALECGLSSDKERIALVCLASSYRNIGEIKNALNTILRARRIYRRNAVVECFYALILHDAGLSNKAIRILGLTLLQEARSEAFLGFEKALENKFREIAPEKE